MFAKLLQYSQSFNDRAGALIKSVRAPEQSRITATTEPVASRLSYFNFNYFIRDTVCVFVYVIVRTVNNIGVFDYGTKFQSVAAPSPFKEITNSDVQSLHRVDSAQSLSITVVDDNREVMKEILYTVEEPTTLEPQIPSEAIETLRKASSSTISSDEGIHSAKGYEIDEIEEQSEDLLEDEEEKESRKPIYTSTIDLGPGDQNKLTLCFTNKGFYDKLKMRLPHKRKDSNEPLPILCGQKLAQPNVPSDKAKTETSVWSRMIKVFRRNRVEQSAGLKSRFSTNEKRPNIGHKIRVEM
ncbi:unnamed protein product [Bursaphelenchus xylophilus]|uniref:(pine wood nematode) hypothetical protein n=1 Tax=Bursaphelenchus xylophilus TaxID=6326 RepID=A0A1I7RYK6_BURXY|nr:unnamed protein product [Bursaphelenchus xylophilus]CAG9092582.1 unnamed protein product [Bursaphelenchus xylophilus]